MVLSYGYRVLSHLKLSAEIASETLSLIMRQSLATNVNEKNEAIHENRMSVSDGMLRCFRTQVAAYW